MSAALTISENTGVTDFDVDPRNQDVMYAAAYQRRRHTSTIVAGGPESAIYKTTDAGAHWTKLTEGIPTVDKGRIALAVSPLFAIVLLAEIVHALASCVLGPAIAAITLGLTPDREVGFRDRARWRREVTSLRHHPPTRLVPARATPVRRHPNRSRDVAAQFQCRQAGCKRGGRPAG